MKDFYYDEDTVYAIVDGYLCSIFQINDPEWEARVVWRKNFDVKVEVSLEANGCLKVTAAEDGEDKKYSAPSEYAADVLGRGGSTYTKKVTKGQLLGCISGIKEIDDQKQLLSKVEEIEGYSLTIDEFNKYAIM